MIPPPPPPPPKQVEKEDAFRKKLLEKFGNFEGSTTDEIEKKLKKSEDIDETCFSEADGTGVLENQPLDTSNCTQCERCQKWIKNESYQHHLICHSTRILDWLYLGAAINSENEVELDKRTNVTYILNAAAECQNYYPQKYQYLKLHLMDTIGETILNHFDEAYEFLEKCRKEGKCALVHCQLGKSRSATIVIMYLMKHLGMNLREAFKYTKEKRYIVNPNIGFIRQMIQFDEQLYGKRSITAHEINPLCSVEFD
ncbi:unnamed protein product (macronuclear) [Paramecium tetraurelia]|uniref:protein-serine/threonine phosphatase n=1 Tax=Paramecium tetraurelia TaxID=5888 RepID=A0E0I9_PARTE|nr:uncharacterized protein GSPATT00021974001 [Paramecium tetraurelia]CAK88806.1 unnamed protein product [Paramecium tetraurelia]|eukprot:XP_001456203.1 hypothetical protein (macronuclear) [Paramecium tetraurelia strain d4-2]